MDAKQDVFEEVAKNKQSLVLYFGSSEDDVLDNVDFVEYVDNGLVVAVVVPKLGIHDEKSPTNNKTSRMPRPKLDSQDLWQAYGVNKAGVFVITDCFGNETDRTTSTKLAKYLVKVGKSIKKRRASVEELTKAGQEAFDDGDTRSALLELHAAFDESLVGYEESDQAVKLYSKILDEGRAELKQAVGSVKKLETLAATFSGSDLEVEISEALTAAKANE